MSELLPSELARLILGYFQSMGYTRTMETMLSELPELAEVSQRKKKGQKTNLRVGDLCLTDVMDDYFASKNLIHDHISKYPSTFNSVKKIQALSEQIRSIMEIAIRSKTYKKSFQFYPKNLYQSKQFIESKISQANAALSNEEVENGENLEISAESGLGIDATPESSLPGSSKRDFCSQDPINCPSQVESFTNEENLALDTTPQKKKGSLRKKGQPSPKVQPKNKQNDADERMEKLIKNLIENKELHTKIADSINNTLFSSSAMDPCKEQEYGNISSKLQLVDGRPVSNLENNRIFNNTGQQDQQHRNCQFDQFPSELRSNSLQDNIISNLSLQVTNDPMMETILAEIDCQSDNNSSHRQLSTPVPHLSPSYTNISFTNSVFGIQADSNIISQPGNQSSLFSVDQQCFSNQNAGQSNKKCSSNMILEECFSPTHSVRTHNMTLKECFKSQDINENNKVTPESTLRESFNQQADVSDKPHNLTLKECFINSTGDSTIEKDPNLMLGDCFKGDERPNVESENIYLKKSFQNTDKISYKLQDSSLEKSLPDCNSYSECPNLESPQMESTKTEKQNKDSQLISETNKDLTCDNLGSLRNVENKDSSSDENSKTNNPDILFSDKVVDTSNDVADGCDEPLDLTLLNTDNELKNKTNVERRNSCFKSPVAASSNDVDHEVGYVPDTMISLQDLCPKTPQLNYQMPPSLSPMRPPSVRAVPVAVSNDAFVHSTYFSGTPDHPNNYVFTELIPLPPSTPQDWGSSSAGGTEKELESSEFITESSPVVFPSGSKILPAETSVGVEDSTSKLIEICISNDESAVIVEIPSVESNIVNFKPSENIEESNKSLSESVQSVKEPKQQHRKHNRKKEKKNIKNMIKSFVKEGKELVPNAEVESTEIEVGSLKRGKKRKNLNSSPKSYNSENEIKSRKKKQRLVNKCSKISFVSSQVINIGDSSLDPKSVESNIAVVNDASQKENEKNDVLRIPNMVAMEELVDKLETNSVEDITSYNNEIQLQTCNNSTLSEDSESKIVSNSANDFSPQRLALISFSKKFVLNNNLSRSTKSPTSNERIKVYKGSLSTPRNKNSHIRVLDFNTPNKAMSLRKKSPRAKTNLKFSPSPPSKKPLVLNGFGNRMRTLSLTVSPSLKRPLEVILETSREVMDLSAAADASVDSRERDEEGNDDFSSKEVETDLFLSEDESCTIDDTSKMPLINKQLTSLKKLKNFPSLYTPGKMSPVCLEPSTPYLGTIATYTKSDSNEAELNTPIPVIVDSAMNATPYMKHQQQPISLSLEENYFQPTERSVSDAAPVPAQEDIESILIKTAQLSEIQMSNLICEENNVQEEKEDVEVSESADNNQSDDPIFREVLKARPKYKLRNMSNKELGKIVEKEMELLNQMKSIVETQTEKNKGNEEGVSKEENHKKDWSNKRNRRTMKENKGILHDIKEKKKLSVNYDESRNNHLERRSSSETSPSNDTKLTEDVAKSNVFSETDELPSKRKTRSREKADNKSSTKGKNIVLQDVVNEHECEAEGVEKMQETINEPNRESVNSQDILHTNSSVETAISEVCVNINSSEKNSKDGINLMQILIDSSSMNSLRSDPESKCKVPAFTHWGNSMVFKRNSVPDSATLGAATVDSSSRDKLNISEDQPSSLHEVITKDLTLKDTENEMTFENENGDKNNLSLETTGKETPVHGEILHSNDDSNDEYSLIERQLAALDGSVTDSPSIRAELTNNAMDDENISAMFTPSTSMRAAEVRIPSCFSSEITNRLHSNSLMAFTRFPGTPEKRMEEICQSMVKNKVALVAIPSQSIEHEREQSKAMCNAIPYEQYDSQIIFKESPRELELFDGYDDNEAVNSESEEDEEQQCALSYSECFDLLSLNLNPQKPKVRKRTENTKIIANELDELRIDAKQRNLVPNFSKVRKDKLKSKDTANLDALEKELNKNKQINIGLDSPKRKKGTKDKLKSTDSENSDRSLSKLKKKCSQEKKYEDNNDEATSTTSSKSLKSSDKFKLNLPSSSRKLDFANTKRKRNEEDEKRISSKARKLNSSDTWEEKSSGLNNQKKSSNHNSTTDVTSKLSPAKIASNSHKKNSNENKRKKKDVGDNIRVAPKVTTSASNFDDTASLEELHLSSSDSDDDQDKHFSAPPTKTSPSPKNITKSLLEGAAFELSKTPKKLQTVISKYPKQDSYFHYNEESMLSIPPTPGKHLFLPITSDGNDAEKSDKTSYVAYEPSFSSYVCAPLYEEGEETNKNIKLLSKEKKKASHPTVKTIGKKHIDDANDVKIDTSSSSSSSRKSKRNVQQPVTVVPNSENAGAGSEDILTKLKSLLGKSNDSAEAPGEKKTKSPKGKNISKKSKGNSSQVKKSSTESSSSNTAEAQKSENSAFTLNEKETKNLKLLLSIMRGKN